MKDICQVLIYYPSFRVFVHDQSQLNGKIAGVVSNETDDLVFQHTAFFSRVARVLEVDALGF